MKKDEQNKKRLEDYVTDVTALLRKIQELETLKKKFNKKWVNYETK
jgi:hypothetical protein